MQYSGIDNACTDSVNCPTSIQRSGAFTLVEMLVVIAIIGLLAALLLPSFSQAKNRTKRIQCVSDLHQTGEAYHVFANDHNGKLPAQVSTNEGGASEFVAAGYLMPGPFYFGFRYIQPLAYALNNPSLLACPADLGRWPGTDFNQFSNTNLSYDVGVVADANDPRWILAADRGLPGNFRNGNESIRQVPGPRKAWIGAHGHSGNILFADTHVELSSDSAFSSQIAVPEDLVYPSVPNPSAIYVTTTVTGHPGSGSGPTDGSADNPAGSSVPNFTDHGSAHPMATQRSQPSSLPAGLGAVPHGVAEAYPHQPDSRLISQPSAVELSNPVAAVLDATNRLEVTNIIAADITNADMSDGNREAARVFGGFLFGTYFLILVLVLAYLAYRVWKWHQKKEQARARARSFPET